MLLVAYAGELAFHFLPAGASEPFQKFATNIVFLSSAALCAVRAFQRQGERAAWLMMALGLLMWGLGIFYFTLFQWDLTDIPTPSPADAGWLLFYPFIYAALVLLYRSRIRPRSAALWIDGAVDALAVGGLGAAIVFQAVLKSTGGSAAAIATDLSYPLADLMLLGLVVGVLAMMGWRRAGAWAWIAAGLAVFVVCDSLYLYGTAVGSYEAGVIYDAGWPAAALLVALGAWTPATTFGENRRMLASSRREASTDALTGLGNRRSLTLDLERVSAAASAQHPACLVLLDLDGFKTYNDSFGHPAGDELLPTRLGRRLAEANGPRRARLPARRRRVLRRRLDPRSRSAPRRSAAAAEAALSQRGAAFAVGASGWFGRAGIPGEAASAEDALRLADRRMYATKGPARRFGSQPDARRAAQRPARARAGARPAQLDGVARVASALGAEPQTGPRRRGARRPRPRRRAARHRQGGDPRRGPAQGRSAERRGVGADAQAHADRRAGAERRPRP